LVVFSRISPTTTARRPGRNPGGARSAGPVTASLLPGSARRRRTASDRACGEQCTGHFGLRQCVGERVAAARLSSAGRFAWGAVRCYARRRWCGGYWCS